MQRALISLILILSTAAVLLLLFKSGTPIPVTDAEPGRRAQESIPASDPEDELSPMVPEEEIPAGARIVTGKHPDVRFTRLDDGRSLFNEGYAIARKLHRSEQPFINDVEHVGAILDLYKWAFQEMPEGGENSEIMAGLTGDNSHRIVFFPPNSKQFDAEGNLLDRWGTPYFMHKMSDQEIDIISAGPDRRLWSDDDLSLGLLDSYQTVSSE